MSRTIHELRGLITSDISSFARGIGQAVQATQGLGQAWTKAAASVSSAALKTTAAVGAVGTAVLAVGRKFSAAAEVQIKSEQKLQAALDATGGAAELSLKQIAEFASARQQITDFGDEVTLSAAGVLATFKNLRGEGFLRTLAAAQDVSAQMGGDLQSSVLQLGKALNDPINGLAMLNRVGISFNKQQQERIKQLQEEGRLFEAQDLILQEVESQFGGTASRVSMSWTRMGNQLGDIVENIGFAFVPTFNAIAEEVMALTAPLANNRAQMEAWGDAIAQRIRDVLPVVKEFAANAWEMLRPLFEFVKAHPQIIGALVAFKVGGLLGINRALVDVGSALGTTFMALGKLPAAIRAVGGALSFLALNPIGAVIAAVGTLVAGLTLFFTKTEIGRQFIARLGEAAGRFANTVGQVLHPLVERLTDLWEQRLLPILNDVADTIGATLSRAIDAVTPLIEKGLTVAFEALAWTLENVVVPVLESVVGMIERAVGMFDTLVQQATKWGIANRVGGEAGAMAGEWAAAGMGMLGANRGAAPQASPQAAQRPTRQQPPQGTAIPSYVPQAAMPEMAMPLAEPEQTPAVDEAAANLAAVTPMLKEFGRSLQTLSQDGTLAREATDQFARQAVSLRQQLVDGAINMDEFQSEMRRLTEATQEAVEAAREKEELERRAALRAGDFSGAGLDPREALNQRIEQFQMQRFNSQIDRMFAAWQQANGYVEQAGQGLQRLADTTDGLRQTFTETKQAAASGGDSGRASQAAGALFSFLNSTAGRIATIINQINLLQQTLNLVNLSAQRREQIMSQIKALQQEYLSIVNAPPPVSLTSPEELFKDPGLQSGEDGGGDSYRSRGGSNITVNLRSLRAPDAADARMIVDTINRELQRTGHQRFF